MDVIICLSVSYRMRCFEMNLGWPSYFSPQELLD